MNKTPDKSKVEAKGKSTPLACKIWGHKWQGDSLKRRCTRCGKTQVSRYSVEGWVDV
ncbi:DUF1660 family phage protein [uncultured Microscilla sp.]|uniref:DUF1660 family phage protein n=1 Tax=uncultured Microscilla sp. TaxID=432653 RepID=UPI002638B796|nr:DUF1660 family phage protein [uncultured Microscilla sp.]